MNYKKEKESSISEKIIINVNFFENLHINQIINYLQTLNNPQIILWYIGCYGLKQSCVEFYRNNFIIPILNKNIQTTFWLFDLTAWNAFKTPVGSIDKFSSFCDIINVMGDSRIRCLKSSDIFKRMLLVSNKNFAKILEKPFLKKASFGFSKTGIFVKDLFLREYPQIMKDWLEKDTSEAYSAFQFLEGCLIVEEIVQILLSNKPINSILEIVFLLPNDELKYYQDESYSFQKSLNLLISQLYKFLDINKIELQVYFFSFPYGNQGKHRPYNAPSKVVNKKKFFLEDIIGSENIINYPKGILCHKS